MQNPKSTAIIQVLKKGMGTERIAPEEEARRRGGHPKSRKAVCACWGRGGSWLHDKRTKGRLQVCAPAAAGPCAQAIYTAATSGLGQWVPQQDPVDHESGKLLACSALYKDAGILSHPGKASGTPGKND